MPNTPYIQSALLDYGVKAAFEAMRADLTGATLTGAVPAAVGGSVVAVEGGSSAVHSTVLTLINLPIVMADSAQGGGVKIYTFPLGKLFRLGASIDNLTCTTKSAIATTLNSGVTCNLGVGSVIQANATVATTEQDIVQVTAWVSGTTIDVANTAVRGYGIPSVTLLDGSVTAIAAFLNLAVAGATDIDADATVWVNGTITMNWLRV